MNDKEIKGIAESLADKVVAKFTNEKFQYDYLVSCLIEAINNSKQ